jgi:hypothetical protein
LARKQSGEVHYVESRVKPIAAPLTGAHIYVTGVNDAKGAELTYFEIPLEK